VNTFTDSQQQAVCLFLGEDIHKQPTAARWLLHSYQRMIILRPERVSPSEEPRFDFCFVSIRFVVDRKMLLFFPRCNIFLCVTVIPSFHPHVEDKSNIYAISHVWENGGKDPSLS
jgi:hypothetical protein